MNILVIPTTDWIRHPVPNRLNFIFDSLTKRHRVFVLHFNLKRFRNFSVRSTKCQLVPSGRFEVEDPSLYYLINAPFHLITLKKLVKEEKIDVILSANILPSFVANLTGVPIIFDYLDHLEESASAYYPGSVKGSLVQKGVRVLTRFNLIHSKRVITVTKELKNYLERENIRHISIIPNGVDINLLKPVEKAEAQRSLGLEGKTVIGYVGSLENWVDLETIIKALPELAGIILLVVGPGLFTSYSIKISRLAEESGVKDRVIFTGAVPYEQINRYISAMDIGLNPLKKMTKNEYALGGKVFNYLSVGKPVLSSRMASLEELFGDDLYYYDNVTEFVEQVKTILSRPQMEEHFRSIAMHFNWEDLAKIYESVIWEAI